MYLAKPLEYACCGSLFQNTAIRLVCQNIDLPVATTTSIVGDTASKLKPPSVNREQCDRELKAVLSTLAWGDIADQSAEKKYMDD